MSVTSKVFGGRNNWNHPFLYIVTAGIGFLGGVLAGLSAVNHLDLDRWVEFGLLIAIILVVTYAVVGAAALLD